MDMLSCSQKYDSNNEKLQTENKSQQKYQEAVAHEEDSAEVEQQKRQSKRTISQEKLHDNEVKRRKRQELRKVKSDTQRKKENENRRQKYHEKKNNKSESQRKMETEVQRQKYQEKKNNKSESQRKMETEVQRQKYQEKKNKKSESQRNKEAEVQRQKKQEKNNNKSTSQRKKETEVRRQKYQEKNNNKSTSQRKKEAEVQRQKYLDQQTSKSDSQRQKENENRRQNYEAKRQQEVEQQELLSVSADGRNDNQEIEFISIKANFDAIMKTWPSTACAFCDRLMYPIGIKSTHLKPENIATLQSYGIEEFAEGSLVLLCHTCYTHLLKKKMSAQSKNNLMITPPTPACILELSSLEIRLISQVKLHLQIFKLCNYTGQYGMKGSAIHFAQAVNEISRQLPLTSIQSDVVVVSETLEAVQSRREFQIRPGKVTTALRWLKQNNHLYKDVEIMNRSIDDMNLENIVVLTQPTIAPIAQLSNYVQKPKYGILRGTIPMAQSNKYFFPINGGKQCAANCASFIAYALIQELHSCSSTTLDKILLDGDYYYNTILQRASEERKNQIENNSGYLHCDDIVGLFQLQNTDLCVDLLLHDEDALQLNGVFDKGLRFTFNGQKITNNVSTLENAIDFFLTLNVQGCILTAARYSMAIYKQESCVYYFDPHSRTPTGRVCKTENGLACLLKFPLATAAKEISSLVHLNIQPKECITKEKFTDLKLADNIQNDYIQKFLFTITPVIANWIDGSSLPHTHLNREINVTLNQRTPSKSNDIYQCHQDLGFGMPQHLKFINPIVGQENKGTSQDLGYGFPQHVERINPHEHTEEEITFDETDIDAYFLHNIDFNEPDIVNYVQNIRRGNASSPMQFHRMTAPPIKEYLEKHLEELSFVLLFPHGTHGFSDNRRKIKQSPLKYFQARVMSSDQRYHSKEYLCYALDRIEKYKIEQQISIVCGMKNQENRHGDSETIPGAYNPHLYLKAIRGGASYWKDFGGDVFAMVNMLGIPTFFLTFSTDDLNSPELMNAIWKSKYGNDSEFVYETLNPEQKQKLLNDHPVLAARYFCTKVKQIISVLEKYGMLLFGRKVIHHIGRIEFQARGSGHYHMIIWCENAPDYNTEAGISFINKNVSVSLETDIKPLVLKYQNHHHTRTCFKNNNSTNCRFNFPRKVSTVTEVLSKEETHKNHGRSIQHARKPNEVCINNYHPKLLQLIRSNMDIQVVGDVNDVVFYIAKYISKAEPEKLTADLQSALATARSSTSDTIRNNLINVANVVTRNRQIGCPEVAFRVLGLPLRFSSVSFQFVSAYKKKDRLRMIQKERLRDNKTFFCMNIIERYEVRPDNQDMKQMSLFEFAAMFEPQSSTAYDDVDEEMEEDFNVIESLATKSRPTIKLLHNKGVMVKRRHPKIVKYPFFNKESKQEEYYYSLLLMFLPFRNEDEILDGYPNSSAAFSAKRHLFRTEENAAIIKLGLSEELNRALLQIREDSEHNLEVPNNPLVGDELYMEDIDAPPENLQPPDNILEILDSRTATFSTEQRQVYDLVRQQIHKDKTTSPRTPLRLFVSGEGGTGKSYVIQTLTLFLRSMLHGVGDPLQIAAPTACAAIPISGLTLHKSFGIPVEIGHTVPPYNKLTASTLQTYRRRYKSLKWIILDEASMISYETFEFISRRMQDIFESTLPFGNLNMLIFGDILQLKPCNGNWIYKQPASMKASTDLWRLFSFVELKVNHRQTGTDPLKAICSRLRVGKTTPEDISHLLTRVVGKEDTWSQNVKNDWLDVIRIYPTNKLANTCNDAHINELKAGGLKIYTIDAVDTYADGNYSGPFPKELLPLNINKTSGIPSQIQIGISVRIMLRCNLSLTDKLVNGSRGAIKAIKWPRLLSDQSTTGQLPESIHVLFDDPTAGGQLKDKSTNLVRIEPRLFDFADKGGRKVHRMMLPCILVAGITCHKVQGQTVSKAVLHLKGWNIFKGGAYVALSRCTSLQGLAITEIDTSELISTDKFSPAELSSIEEYKRLSELNTNHTLGEK